MVVMSTLFHNHQKGAPSYYEGLYSVTDVKGEAYNNEIQDNILRRVLSRLHKIKLSLPNSL
jgi:hypothetical protein